MTLPGLTDFWGVHPQVDVYDYCTRGWLTLVTFVIECCSFGPCGKAKSLLRAVVMLQ